jgi:Leucine Rich Repeat.
MELGNKIGEVSVENWRGLTNSLQTLILADNAISTLPINSFSSLTFLKTLDLRRNHLEQLDVDVFHDGPPRLLHLLLTDNQLSSIPYQQLSSLHMLRTLDLASNNIVNLHKSEHQGLGTLMSLDTLHLDYNQIKHLPSRAFQYFHILNRTNLNGNPLITIEVNMLYNFQLQ